AITGDLTSAFNFRSPNDGVVTLPSTAGYMPPDYDRHPDYVPTPPSAHKLPVQEAGIKPARPVPYELHVRAEADASQGELRIHFGNSGRSAAVFQVRAASGQAGPWTYTVGADAHVVETWALRANGQSSYDLSVHGPNGFLRSFKGGIAGRERANLTVRAT